MPAAETPFEVFALALEATRKTAVTPPTHILPMNGMLTPNRPKYRPVESRGTLSEFYRSKTIRTGCDWVANDILDLNYAPVLLNMVMKALTSPATPTNGVLTRLWTFTPTLTSDDIKSATLYGGDPNVQIWQAAGCMADELTVDADASGTDGCKWSLKGKGLFPSRVAAPSFPASIAGNLVVPGAMQLWIDVASAIGTTEVTGRFIKTNWKIPTGVTYKHYANGPTGGLGYTKTGRKKRHAEASITVELNDVSVGSNAEYQRYEADSVVKMRIRLNGPLIESVTPDYYEYLQLDIYGSLDALAWGDVEGSNRTMTFTVQSEYQSSPAHDFALSVQNQRTAL